MLDQKFTFVAMETRLKRRKKMNKNQSDSVKQKCLF